METRKPRPERLDSDLIIAASDASAQAENCEATVSGTAPRKMPGPSVSVVMPVYNGARWLESSARSVIEQSVTDLELVIVDDGSIDRTPQIIARLAAADKRIRPLRKENSGIADSLNLGIAVARGRWICRLDADDLASPDRIERQLKLAKSIPSAVLIGGDHLTVDSEGNALRPFSYPTAHTKLLKQLLDGGRFFAHSSIMFRRDKAIAVGGYRPRISKAEDHDLWMRLAEVGTFHGVGAQVIKYRLHDAQTSYQDGGVRQALDKLIAVTSYHLRRFGYADPVDGSDAEFESFRVFVEERARARRFPEEIGVRILLSRLRREVGNGSLFASLVQIFFSDPALVFRLVLSRIGADTTALRTAQAWMKQLSPKPMAADRPGADPLVHEPEE